MAKYYSTTLQKGSKGAEVSEWQKFLNSQGYSLGVDGDFGDKTYAATTDWQTKNGLGADGIVGEKSWGKAGYTKLNYTPTAAPTLKPYETGSWDDSTEGKAALNAKNNIFTSIYGTYNPEKGKYEGGYGPFTFSQDKALKDVKEDIDELKPFSYNIDEDALYQQYKDKYVQQAKLAMADTMGQAAAMTGGYGSSYAQSVGQQAYQGQLDNLNDIVPELYQMALDKYTMDKDALYDKYGMLISEYNREYGEYGDGYKKLLDQLGITTDEYWQGRDAFNTEQNNTNDVIGKENSDAWKQADWEENNRRDTLDRAEEAKDDFETGNTGDTGVKGGGNVTGHNIDKHTLAAGNTPNATKFISSYSDKSTYLASGKTEAQWNAYMEDNIAAAIRSGTLSDPEVLYLIDYYGLS